MAPNSIIRYFKYSRNPTTKEIDSHSGFHKKYTILANHYKQRRSTNLVPHRAKKWKSEGAGREETRGRVNKGTSDLISKLPKTNNSFPEPFLNIRKHY